MFPECSVSEAVSTEMPIPLSPHLCLMRTAPGGDKCAHATNIEPGPREISKRCKGLIFLRNATEMKQWQNHKQLSASLHPPDLVRISDILTTLLIRCYIIIVTHVTPPSLGRGFELPPFLVPGLSSMDRSRSQQQ